MQTTTRMAGSSDQIASFWRVIREETRETNNQKAASERARHAESRIPRLGGQSRDA